MSLLDLSNPPIADPITSSSLTSPYGSYIFDGSIVSAAADDDDDPPSPSFTPYGSTDPDSGPNSSGILNYYFLLLAILIVVVLVAYYFISRRRKRKISQLRNNGQVALARDLEGWPGSLRWAGGRWRGGERMEEGLNERGEAPPPYVPRVPAEAVIRDDGVERGVPLRDLGERKPPDYHPEGSIPRLD